MVYWTLKHFVLKKIRLLGLILFHLNNPVLLNTWQHWKHQKCEGCSAKHNGTAAGESFQPRINKYNFSGKKLSRQGSVLLTPAGVVLVLKTLVRSRFGSECCVSSSAETGTYVSELTWEQRPTGWLMQSHEVDVYVQIDASLGERSQRHVIFFRARIGDLILSVNGLFSAKVTVIRGECGTSKTWSASAPEPAPHYSWDLTVVVDLFNQSWWEWRYTQPWGSKYVGLVFWDHCEKKLNVFKGVIEKVIRNTVHLISPLLHVWRSKRALLSVHVAFLFPINIQFLSFEILTAQNKD